MAEQQAKSKQCVVDHDGVFTTKREVKAMCDPVRQGTERIESRFLEPACGDGSFLTEILIRELAMVESRYGKSPFDCGRYSVLTMTGLYGVDILEDNAEECRQRLFDIWDKEYTTNAKSQADEQCRGAVWFILYKDVLCGDALTMLQINGFPTIFAGWSLVTGNQMKRRDFALDELLNGHEEQMDIFMIGWEYDEEVQAFIPSPIKEYPLTDYRRVQDYE